MTSITMSKSPKHFVRDLTLDVHTPGTAMALLRATAARVHKEILHLPIRSVPQSSVPLPHTTPREER